MSKLTTGICGSISPHTPRALNPLPTIRQEDVQAMLLDLNRRPRSRKQLEADYPGMGPEIAQLVDVGALRDDGLVHVFFTFLDAEDRDLVFEVTARHGSKLGSEIAARRDQLHRALEPLASPPVDTPKLAFMAVGCYFLDLLALRLLGKWGLADIDREQPGENTYTLWAEVKGSLRGVYWGCHSLLAGDYLFQTFGDHDAETRRQALPDILHRMPDLDFPGGNPYRRLLWEGRLQLAEEIGRVLDAAASGPLPAAPGGRQALIIDLLSELGYLEQAGGTFRPAIPLFTSVDAGVLAEVASLLEPVLGQWCEIGLPELERDLRALRPIQNGVPFSEVLVHLWHYVFGLANRELASVGVIHDTYGDGAGHRGYMPAVMRGQVLDEMLQRLGLA